MKGLIGSLIFLAAVSTPSHAEPAVQLIKDLAVEVFDIIDKVPEQDKHSRYCQMVKDFVDLDEAGRYIMKYQSPSDESMKRFLELFPSVIVATFSSSFEKGKGGRMEVKDKVIPMGPRVGVLAELYTKSGSKTSIRFILRKFSPNEYQIFDAVVDGFSLLSTRQAEYGSVMQRYQQQGSLDPLADLNKELEDRFTQCPTAN